jgi:hypothetical protein
MKYNIKSKAVATLVLKAYRSSRQVEKYNGERHDPAALTLRNNHRTHWLEDLVKTPHGPARIRNTDRPPARSLVTTPTELPRLPLCTTWGIRELYKFFPTTNAQLLSQQ